MSLRLVRYQLTNRHGVNVGQRFCLSSAPAHDLSSARLGNGDMVPTVLDVAEVDTSTGRIGIGLAHLHLAGVNQLRFTAAEAARMAEREAESGRSWTEVVA